MLCSLSYLLSWHIHYLNPSLIHRHSRIDKQGHMGERSGSGFAPVWAPLQTVQTRHPQATRPSSISLDRLASCTVTRWHVPCSNVNHVFLLTRYHARTSENIQISEPYRFYLYEAAFDHLDQATVFGAGRAHKDHLHTATFDRHRGRSVCGDHAPVDRMRPRATDRQRIDRNTSSSHRISGMAPG